MDSKDLGVLIWLVFWGVGAFFVIGYVYYSVVGIMLSNGWINHRKVEDNLAYFDEKKEVYTEQYKVKRRKKYTPYWMNGNHSDTISRTKNSMFNDYHH
ncbi:hypothetical protein [Psychromonas aquimarina]|uniref:hypothetical protein n=1 Tax=Psychromonas aquimarina TaxID=444919 RepID=UPI000416CE3E|nr:hypothetical protein [Psychromonas aquimarina]